MPEVSSKPSLNELIRKRRKFGTDEIVIGSSSPAPGNEVQAGSMADVMQRVDGIKYLVKDWIPFAMLTMIVAPPGIGKSAFALFALARPIVMGDLFWFNGMKGPIKPSYVLWCDTEGSAAITVQRIKDWGLPAERIKVPFNDDPLRPINLSDAEHIAQMKALIVKYRIHLVVIDSLRGAHNGDENSSRVAEVLQNLASIAEETKAAIVVIHHTRKIHVDEEMSADCSRGSNAIIAMVRSQLGIDKPNKDSEWCRLQMLKENLGLKPRPIGFCVSSKGLEFGIAPEKPRKETQRDKAEDWLRDYMRPGKWYPAAELLDDAKQFGYSPNAMQRARELIGIVKPTHVRKFGKTWKWQLPT
jgi:hypothetical protein